jgi:hypothetical protein
MNAKDILKSVLDRTGMITITESDLDRLKDQDIGIIETWDDDGKRKYTIYTHPTRKK